MSLIVNDCPVQIWNFPTVWWGGYRLARHAKHTLRRMSTWWLRTADAMTCQSWRQTRKRSGRPSIAWSYAVKWLIVVTVVWRTAACRAVQREWERVSNLEAIKMWWRTNGQTVGVGLSQATQVTRERRAATTTGCFTARFLAARSNVMLGRWSELQLRYYSAPTRFQSPDSRIKLSKIVCTLKFVAFWLWRAAISRRMLGKVVST